jgi:hypothetical protein
MITNAERMGTPVHFPVPWGERPPATAAPASQQLTLWTAWHTACLVITVTDLGLATTLLILHYTVATILYLLGTVQAMGLGVIGGLYQLTSKTSS